MNKTAFTDGFSSSRFIISTTTKKDEHGYTCKGRVVQGRGTLNEEGTIDWDDREINIETSGDTPEKIESLALETLFQYMISKEYYLFEDKEEERVDDNKDDLQEV